MAPGAEPRVTTPTEYAVLVTAPRANPPVICACVYREGSFALAVGTCRRCRGRGVLPG